MKLKKKCIAKREMMLGRKGIFIMSLNSRRLKDAIANRNNFYFNNEVDELDVFVFDTLEILNGIFFNSNDAGKQKIIIEEIIDKLEKDFVAVDTVKRELIRCSKIRKELNPFIQVVYNEIYSNLAFEKHCKNQIFTNLQPKLKAVDVFNNKSNLIELLLPFLVIEIAFYLKMYCEGEYTNIYGMETEMEIIKSIANNKYPSFKKFLNTKIEYIKIEAA